MEMETEEEIETFEQLLEVSLYQVLKKGDDPSYRATWTETTVGILRQDPKLVRRVYTLHSSDIDKRQKWRHLLPFKELPPNRKYQAYIYCNIFFLLVYFGATKKQIELVYKIHRESIQWKDGELVWIILGGYPDFDTVSFLLQENPALASQPTKNKIGQYTLAPAILLKHKELTTTGSDQEEEEEDDDIISVQDDGKFIALVHRLIPTVCDGLLWKCAMSAGCSDETMELISNYLQPNKITKLVVGMARHPIVVTERNVKWISQVFPHIKKFTVGDTGIENADAFVSLMRCMANNANSVTDLSLGLRSSWIQEEENGAAIDALQHMLATCETLKRIMFSFGGQGMSNRWWRGNDHNHSMVIKAICKGLCLRKKEPTTIVQHLQLQYFNILCRDGQALLDDTLMIPSLPVRQLTLQNVRVQCSTLSNGENYHIGVNQQYLEELSLAHFSMTANSSHLIKPFILCVANFRSLKRLKVSYLVRSDVPRVDVTDEVVQLISQSRTLEELQLTSPHLQMDLSRIYEAMIPNYTLKDFHMLQHSTTTTTTTTNPVHQWEKKIMYITHLNRYGRQKAGSPQTNKSMIVQLLQAVPAELPGTPTNRNSALRTTIHYGLLHQKPDTWAT